MAKHEITGPYGDNLYNYRGASIELSSLGTRRWWATVRFRQQEKDFEAKSSDEALEKAKEWIDTAPENTYSSGQPREAREAPRSDQRFPPGRARPPTRKLDADIIAWNNGDAYRTGTLEDLKARGLVAWTRRGWEPTDAGVRAGLHAPGGRELDERVKASHGPRLRSRRLP